MRKRVFIFIPPLFNLLWWLQLNPIGLYKSYPGQNFCLFTLWEARVGRFWEAWVSIFFFSKRQLCSCEVVELCSCSSTGAAGPGNPLLGKFSPPAPLLLLLSKGQQYFLLLQLHRSGFAMLSQNPCYFDATLCCQDLRSELEWGLKLVKSMQFEEEQLLYLFFYLYLYLYLAAFEWR